MFRSPVIPPSLWYPLCVWGLRVHNSQIDREQLEVSQCDVSQETGCWETGRAGPVWLWLTAHSAAVDKNTSVHRPHHSPLTTHLQQGRYFSSKMCWLGLGLHHCSNVYNVMFQPIRGPWCHQAHFPLVRLAYTTQYTVFPQSLALVLSNCRLIVW